MTIKDKVAYDEFGRRGVHNKRLGEIIELLSKEIVTHCVREVPPSEGMSSLIANVNSLSLQVISHLIYKVTRDQYELKQALLLGFEDAERESERAK